MTHTNRYCLDKFTDSCGYCLALLVCRHAVIKSILSGSLRMFVSAVQLPRLTSRSSDLLCGLKQPMGLVSPWLWFLVTGLTKAVILVNRAGASASSWNVRLWRMHTQFSTDFHSTQHEGASKIQSDV